MHGFESIAPFDEWKSSITAWSLKAELVEGTGRSTSVLMSSEAVWCSAFVWPRLVTTSKKENRGAT